MRGAPAQAGREGRDPHGGARAVRLVRELRAALPRRRRDPEGSRACWWRTRTDVPRPVRRSTCRTGCEAIKISPDKKTVDLRNVATGEVTTESYDKLVLSPGAPSIRPPLPGIDLPGIFQVRTVPDARAIREWIERGSAVPRPGWTGTRASRSVQAQDARGGGRRRVHRPRDGGEPRPSRVRRDARRDGSTRSWRRSTRRWRASSRATWSSTASASRSTTAWPDSSRPRDGALEVLTKSGKTYPADIVILALGVRPDTALAKTAGLEIGERGGIRVDEHMRTSNPDIFAVGDAVEVKDFVTGEWSLIALAGPANRQGRIAADVIAGRDSRFRGTPGHLDHRTLRRRGGLDRRQREDAQAARRHGLREDLPLPELARRLLPGRQADRDEGHLPQVRRAPPRRAGARRGRRGQADQRPRDGDPDGRDRLRPRGGRAVLRAASSAARRTRSTSRGWSPPTSCAATCRSVTGTAPRRAFLLDVREPVELAVETRAGRGQHPAAATPRAPRRASPRPGDPRHLPLRRSAPTTRRASCCRTGSRPGTSPAACCREPTRRTFWTS